MKRQVLDDEIELIIGILDTRDGDMPDFMSDPREDDITDVTPEIVLPGEFAFRVHQKVLHKLRPCIPVALVEWVHGKSFHPMLRLVED